MMMFKDLVTDILRVCRASNDDPLKTTVKSLVNIKYFDLCREFSVRALRTKLTVDFIEFSVRALRTKLTVDFWY